jgi:hypothetical protein
MGTVRLLVTILLLGVCSFTSKGQKQFSGWLASFNSIKTGMKTSIHSDVQFRSNNDWQQMQTLLLRPGINYHVNKKLTLTAGYAYIRNRKVVGDMAGYIPEHRIWEQLLYTHEWKNLRISHRFRMEQRFIGKTVVLGNPLSDGPNYANRFRYFLRNILPLKKETSFSKGPFLALQNELFLNFGDKASVNGKTFDQNRLYLALGHRFNSAFDLELGYMNQYINGRGSQFTNNHIVQLATYLRL